MAAKKKAAAQRGAKSAAKKGSAKDGNVKPAPKPKPPKPAPAKPSTASTGEVLADLGLIAKQIRFYERKLEGQQAAVKETKERLAQLRGKLVDEAQEFGGGQTALPLADPSQAPRAPEAIDPPADPPGVDRVRVSVDGKEVEVVKLEGKWNGNIDGKPHVVNVGTLAAAQAAIENEIGKPITWPGAPEPAEAEAKPKPKRTRRKRST